MITVQNYSQKINSINWNKVPKEIANIKNDVDFSIEFYNDDDGIKETVDLFLKQANKVYNEQLKAEIEAGVVIDIDGTKVKETIKKTPKAEPKYLYEGLKVEIREVPVKNYPKGKYFIWDIAKKEMFANEYFKTKVQAIQFINQNKMNLVVESNNNKTERKSTRTQIGLLPHVKALMPQHQQNFLNQLNSEEYDDVLISLEKDLAAIPKKQQEGPSENQTVYAHYFYGGSDWFILDISNDLKEFFGYAILNNDYEMSELGYISVDEIVKNGKIELDFYFTTDTLEKILNKISNTYFPIKEKSSTKTSSSTKTVPKKTVAKKVDKKIVDNFSKEFMLIRRAYNMISKNEVVPFRKMQLLYAAFQKAAVGREVRKTSEDANLFTKVNKKIVAIYNIAEPKKFDVDIDFTDKSLLSEMESYSKERKINYAITLLKSFITMQGTRPDTKKAENLLKRINNAINNKTIDNNNRLWADINIAKTELQDYIKKPLEKIEAEIHGLSLPKRSLCKNRIKCAGLRNDGKLRKGYKFLTDGSVKKVNKSIPKSAKKKIKKIASKRKLGSLLININPIPPQAAIVVNEGATMAAPVDMAPQITTFQEEKQPEPLQPQKPPLKRVRNKMVQGITEAKLAAANVKLFNFSGPLAQFLGNLEKKHTHSVVITLDAPPGSGKTRALFQMVNMAANAGLTSVFFSLEEHPQSKLFSDKASLYIDAKNERLIDVVGELPSTYDEFIKIIEHYDFIGIDSWNKAFEFYGVDFDNDLRKRLNGKLIAAIFQRTQDGKMRGGAKASFDGDVILEVVKDDDFRNSYLQARKNRYQDTPLNEIGYNFYHKKLINPYQLNNFEVPTQMQI